MIRMVDVLRYTVLTYGILLAVFSLLALVAPGRAVRCSAPAQR